MSGKPQQALAPALAAVANRSGLPACGRQDDRRDNIAAVPTAHSPGGGVDVLKRFAPAGWNCGISPRSAAGRWSFAGPKRSYECVIRSGELCSQRTSCRQPTIGVPAISHNLLFIGHWPIGAISFPNSGDSIWRSIC